MASSRRDKIRLLVAVARRQHGVATTQQALDAGFTYSAISRAVRSGDWKRAHGGIYVVDAAADPIRAAAVAQTLRAPGRTWASHRTAAWLWDVVTTVPLQPDVATVANLRGGRATIHRLGHMPASDVTVHRLIPVTTPARTLVDLATVVPSSQLEAAAAEALRLRVVTVDDLLRTVAALSNRGRRGPRALARIIDGWSREAAPESVLEARLLRVIHRAGLPPPVPQYRVFRGGSLLARLDFAYPREMVAIEADGYRWHGDVTRWRTDLGRRNELARLGWRVLHFTWRDVTARPAQVVDTVRAALDLGAQAPENRE
ncbi:MAG TPA: type IV toxin-antitoxin system AbiEi family antitoxin domain-containing protein [Actinomycetota bacterium]|nr:type IV toxin-antitoxin system AbiEi family antitoxin domain-containing protein [Actinomycetota bacterium]